MSDPTDAPTPCIPPDPSVGGWWWLGYADKNNEFPLWWEADGKYWENGFDAERATAYGYRILGPVTPHAEVEALRAENARLRATIEIVHYKLGTGGWALPLILRDMQDALNGQSDAATRALLREIGLLRAEGTALTQILFALPKGTLVVPPSAQTAIHNAILAASAPAPEDK